MKKTFLVLLALLALLSVAQLMAQAPPAAVPPANGAAAPAPDVAQFLATLAGDQAKAPSDLMPAPTFKAGCPNPCPTGEICCVVCGNPPDDGGSCLACVTPFRGRCPRVV